MRLRFSPAYVIISNTATLDGIDLLLPRVGFTWDASDAITVRGGVGVF